MKDVDQMAAILSDILDNDRPVTSAERDLIGAMLHAAYRLGVCAIENG